MLQVRKLSCTLPLFCCTRTPIDDISDIGQPLCRAQTWAGRLHWELALAAHTGKAAPKQRQKAPSRRCSSSR